MKKLLFFLWSVVLFALVGCQGNKPQSNEWDGQPYAQLPQMSFGQKTSINELVQKEKGWGGTLESDTPDPNNPSTHFLVFTGYPNSGIYKRAYYLKQEQISEAIQLIRPLDLVIEYKVAKDEPTLNPLFEKWARSLGYNLIRSRIKDIVLMNESAKLQMIAVPAQIGGQGEVFAEIHYMPMAE